MHACLDLSFVMECILVEQQFDCKEWEKKFEETKELLNLIPTKSLIFADLYEVEDVSLDNVMEKLFDHDTRKLMCYRIGALLFYRISTIVNNKRLVELKDEKKEVKFLEESIEKLVFVIQDKNQQFDLSNSSEVFCCVMIGEMSCWRKSLFNSVGFSENNFKNEDFFFQYGTTSLKLFVNLIESDKYYTQMGYNTLLPKELLKKLDQLYKK
jgi:hypothetical protein